MHQKKENTYTITIYNLRTLPFPAMISLLNTSFLPNFSSFSPQNRKKEEHVISMKTQILTRECDAKRPFVGGNIQQSIPGKNKMAILHF